MNFERKLASQSQEYDQLVEELREELGEVKEKLVKLQKNEAALEIYKKQAGESTDLKRQLTDHKEKVMEFEMQATEWEVKGQELDKLQKAIDYYKEEAKSAL